MALVWTPRKSGRLGYSDLKEAALSRAADLWALNRLEVFSVGSGPEFWVCREGQRQVLMAVNELRNVVEACRQAKTRAVEVTAGAGRVWIASHFQQGCGTGVEQQAIDQPLVLQGQRSQFTRQREHGMDVARGQQLPLALLEPADAGVALAPGAVSVATRVIGDGGVSAAGALIAMATESSGAATRDRSQHLLMLAVEPLVTAFDETLPCVANDVGHLQRRPACTLRIAFPGVAS